MPLPSPADEAVAVHVDASSVVASGDAAALPAIVLVDAMNLAYWCGAPPSLRVPLSLLAHCLGIGIDARLYFDASAAYRLPDDEREAYARLRRAHPARAIEVPSGRSADGLMLRDARRSGACIISRDRYRDHRRRYRKLIDDPTRLLPGHVAADRIHVVGLGLSAILEASADAAWHRLLAVLPVADDAASGGVAGLSRVAETHRGT